MHIHILGICGTLMGSIALLARELGFEVSGSDQNVYPPMSTQLENAGITLSSPYSAENVPADADLVIIGNAGLPRGNPAVEAVLNRQMPYTSGAEWLGREVLSQRWVIAVAGTHGKTTTSAMVAWILEYAGMSPGFLIGGVPLNFDVSARAGDSPFFVIEADEYDTSYFDRRSKFLHYRPRTAVLNNLEYDHADIFPDLAAIQNQFHLLMRTIPGNGLVIHPADDANLAEVFQQGCWTERLSTGAGGNIEAVRCSDDGREFEVAIDGHPAGTIRWELTGRHNIANGLAAIAAARHAGVPAGVAIAALADFRSVKRRMEIIFQQDGVTVYDDFAHHPTAIASTLNGLRNRVGSEAPILAIIEPGSHTMRNGAHQTTLNDSVCEADHVIWYKPDNVQWEMQRILCDENTDVLEQVDNIVTAAKQWLVNQDQHSHVLIMSNSGFQSLHTKLTKTLDSRIEPNPD